MMLKHTNDQNGFTLLEMLIVLAMLGIVMTAVYSVYDVQQKTAYRQEDVVEVQQNLRIGIDELSRDLKMSGILLPPGSGGSKMPALISPTDNTGIGGSDSVTINTTSASGLYARIAQTITATGGDTNFIVDSSESVDPFHVVGTQIRIIRARDSSEPSTGTFTVKGTNRATKTIIITGPPAGTVYFRGDVIAAVAGSVRYDTIRYVLGSGGTCPANQTCLMRQVNGGALNPIATNITNLQLRYLMKDYTEIDAPTVAQLTDIRGVRITLSGQTVATNVTSGGPKKSQLISVVKIRN